MDISNIISGMRPLRARMHMNRILDFMLYGFVAGALLVLLLQAAMLVFPITFTLISRRSLALLLFAVSMFISVFIALLLRPSIHETAKTGDSLGLKERLLTALELSQEMDPIARMQRYDALKQLEALDFRKLYPIRLDLRKAAIGFLVVLIAAGVSFIPSPARDRAERQEKFYSDAKSQAEAIAVEREKLAENKSLTSSQAKEADKKLMELQKDLLKAKSESDVVKAMNKAKEELKRLENQEKQLKSLGEKLAGHPETQDLSDKLKEGNLQQIEEEIKQLNDRIKNMNASEREAFADFIKNAAEKIKNDPQLAQRLQDMASAMTSGDLGALSDQLPQLSSSLVGMAAADASFAQALSALQGAIQGSLQQSGGQSAAASQQGSSSQQASASAQPVGNQSSQQSGNSGSSAQNGQGSGQNGGGQGSGQNGQNGQGNGQGSQGGRSQGNQGGGGAGSGTSNADLPYSDITGAQGSKDSPAGKQVKDYEKIYTPSHLGGDSEASNVSGIKGTQGQSEFREKDKGSGSLGGPVPYNQVYGQYKSEAMQNIQEGLVSPSMRKIVEDYFTSLE